MLEKQLAVFVQYTGRKAHHVHLIRQWRRNLKRKRSYSRVTKQALSVFGKLIRVARTERSMTAQALADRANISRTTLYNNEKGAPGPEIGTVFEIAALVGMRLFDVDESALAMYNARLDEKLTLLPKSVRTAKQEFDDDF